ncbi:hypothetical protein AQI88_36380 [Streptomyces cellostaticus]|uniref:Uncharacterized protein n=1 Tax=Streptomyces cellostaticus TaxID=67285 RepID=A0A101NE28_9ACTN|nr:hypothetical protein AQI88_36380 [Streptomyces cellostaticus]
MISRCAPGRVCLTGSLTKATHDQWELARRGIEHGEIGAYSGSVQRLVGGGPIGTYDGLFMMSGEHIGVDVTAGPACGTEGGRAAVT